MELNAPKVLEHSKRTLVTESQSPKTTTLQAAQISKGSRPQIVEKSVVNGIETNQAEFVFKRNQELMERKKKNERSNVVFAFGSSMPRMLDGTDTNIPYCGSRKNATQNITSLNPSSHADVKKCPNSVTSLEKSGTFVAGSASGYVGRRRTDLVPTIPSNDFGTHLARKSPHRSPGRGYSMTRLDQLAKPKRRESIDAGPDSFRNLALYRGKSGSNRAHMKEQKLLACSNNSEALSRPSSSLSQRSTNSVARGSEKRLASATSRKARPVSIAVTGVTNELKVESKPPIQKKPNEKLSSRSGKKSSVKNESDKDKSKLVANDNSKSEICNVPPNNSKLTDTNEKNKREVNMSNKVVSEIVPTNNALDEVEGSLVGEVGEFLLMQDNSESKITTANKTRNKEETDIHFIPKTQHNEKPLDLADSTAEKTECQLHPEGESYMNEMTSSMTKSRITTEKEAKAAIAEKRRLIREEAEKQAELERLRIESEARTELERQQQEEEQLRKLIELQRQQEQERLQEAIREVEKHKHEEKMRREEEQRMKLLREETEKLAREEADKQKAELQEKLKNEEIERDARRKRVEAIMLRTRGRNNANLTSPSIDERNGNNSEGIEDIIEIEKQENSTTTIVKDIVDNL